MNSFIFYLVAMVVTKSGLLKRVEKHLFALPSDDPDVQHFMSCPERSYCCRCKWALYKVPWQQKMRLDPKDPGKGSWVYGDGNNDKWGLKCFLCVAAGQPGPFTDGFVSNNLKQSLLSNHANSKGHTQALGLLHGESAEVEGAPPETAFLQLLDAIRLGRANGDKGVCGVGKRWKCRRMKFCMAEARRDEVRTTLREASVVCISQDARKGLLALRFAACNDDLVVTTGVLGSVNLPKRFTLDALGHRKATLTVVQEICTPRLHVPGRTGSSEVDGLTLTNLFAKVEMINTDAAADEITAAKMLQGTRAAGPDSDYAAVLPNLRVYNRDKPHAARRTPAAGKGVEPCACRARGNASARAQCQRACQCQRVCAIASARLCRVGAGWV